MQLLKYSAMFIVIVMAFWLVIGMLEVVALPKYITTSALFVLYAFSAFVFIATGNIDIDKRKLDSFFVT